MYSVTIVAVCCLLTLTKQVDAEDWVGSICDDNPCENDGRCKEIKGSGAPQFECKCRKGFYGPICSLISDGEDKKHKLDDVEKKAQQYGKPEFAEDTEDKVPKDDPEPAKAKAEEAEIEESGFGGYGGFGKGYSKRYNPFYKYVHPCECLDSCCIGTTLKLDFTRYRRGTVNGIPDFVEMIQWPEYHWSEFHDYWWLDCFYPALLKISFGKITNFPLSDYAGLCQNSPGCGRRMIRIDLELANPYHRSGGHRRMFNFGDSKYNYGGRRDYPDRQNWDANIEGGRYRLRFHGHEHCKRYHPWILDDALNYKVGKVTLWIAHNFIRVKNYVGFDERFCTSCGFKLNGEYDYKHYYGYWHDNRNQDIYLAFNRAISSPNYYYYRYRYGYGVCRSTVRYECGWKYDCCDKYHGIHHGYSGYNHGHYAEEAGEAEKS